MQIALYSFLFSTVGLFLIIGIVVCLAQKKSNTKFGNAFASPSDNCKMNIDRYSGKYTLCKKTGVADAEF